MTAEEAVGGLKELLTTKITGVLDLIKEKDALYTDRDTARQKAVEAALKAAQTGVDAAFAASEKAIGKSDQNAEKWRENANEWRAAMMDREIKFASRTEVENEMKNLRNELGSLKESRAASVGGWAAAVAVLSLLAAYGFMRTPVTSAPTTPTPATAPLTIYVPAPNGTQLPVTPPGLPPR